MFYMTLVKENIPHLLVTHLPYVLDATENAGIPISGAITPNDIRDVIKEYVIEQDANTEEENFNVTSLSSPSTLVSLLTGTQT